MITNQERREAVRRIANHIHSKGFEVGAETILLQDEIIDKHRVLSLQLLGMTFLILLLLLLVTLLNMQLQNEVNHLENLATQFCLSAAPNQNEFCEMEINR